MTDGALPRFVIAKRNKGGGTRYFFTCLVSLITFYNFSFNHFVYKHSSNLFNIYAYVRRKATQLSSDHF